jgi:hypothetical protein
MKMNRRSFVKNAAAAGLSTSAISTVSFSSQSPQKNSVPSRFIKDKKISRLIIGGNPFSGNAHAEPLVYSSELFKTYFTNEKVIETLDISVANGIDTFLGRIDANICGLMDKYKKRHGHYIPWIGQTAKKPMSGASKLEIAENIKMAVDHGATGIYLQGQSVDYWVRHNQMDEMKEHVEYIRSLGKLAGIGAHDIESIVATEEAQVNPDFYMKTFNSLEFECPNYPKTVSVMSQITTPWIAFKVLAAGRLEPEEGFVEALKANADFLCVGMFDFQVERNVKLMNKLLSST